GVAAERRDRAQVGVDLLRDRRHRWTADWGSAALFGYQRRVDDIPVRRVPDELERVTRHQRQHRPWAGIEHPDVFRVDDLRVGDLVPVDVVARLELERIADLQTPHGPEGGIAMARDADVAGLSRKRRVLDVARGAGQGVVVAPLENR